MASPDSYWKLNPLEFEMAMGGQSPQVKWAYVKVISHYRCHNHCRGLQDDDNFLRRLCEVENEEDWAKVKPIIFDNEFYFCIDTNGLWQQARAAEDYRIDCIAYDKAVVRSKHAINARWRKKKK